MMKLLSPNDLEVIQKKLDGGGIVAFPTETVYGLGVDISDEKAIAQLYKIKGRDFSKPLSIFISSVKMLRKYVEDISPMAMKLMATHWPGPLTLVFKASENVPEAILAAGDTVGIRMSSHPYVTQILNQFQKPITATSANRSGFKSARSAAEVRAYFPNDINCIVENPLSEGEVESTVVDVSHNQCRVLREGAIESHELITPIYAAYQAI